MSALDSLRHGRRVEGDHAQGHERSVRPAHRRLRRRHPELGAAHDCVRDRAGEQRGLAPVLARRPQLVRHEQRRVGADARQDDDRVPRQAGDVHVPRRRHHALVVCAQ